MTTVSHKDLTGADLHEPKGAATAASGTVYVANGSGSGAWTTLAALTGTVGKVEMFATPVLPSGWLECDGTAVSRTTYSDLFTAQTIQQTGTRTNGTTGITGLSDTTSMKVGYYIGGSGITNGTTIAAVPSGTTITLSANATSTGSSTVIVSPYPLGNGTSTFTLPNMTDTGRFPRSRTTTIVTGTYQFSQNKAHTHTFSTDSSGATSGLATDNENAAHNHLVPAGSTTFIQLGATPVTTMSGTSASGTESNGHAHGFTVPNHVHTGTTASSGSSEGRPDAVSFIFGIKY